MLHTRVLKLLGRSDIRRWSNPESLFRGWEERTIVLAGFIPPATSVLELGPGRGVLRHHLPEGCSYTAADLVAADADTIILDLNHAAWPELGEHDVIVMSGVIEYVYDLERMIRRLGDIGEFVICSYASIDMAGQSDISVRRGHGWVNDLSVRQLERLFGDAGFSCVRRDRWCDQHLFAFRKGGAR